jgi:ubiquinone/menaquinone biosynthesis C-methylase UbiE
MYERFLIEAKVGRNDSVLDVGVTSDRSYSSSNYLEKWYPEKSKITAIGTDDAAFLPALYRGMVFIRANGLALPFRDNSFDVVHSSAVLEHVGTFENQTKLISECGRVARRAVFLTTPNRWFPVEFHTILPLVHWFPKPMFHWLMRHTGRPFFAEKANLNLMTPDELRRASRASFNAHHFKYRVSSVKLGGWPSNLLLIGIKSDLAREV